MMGRGGRKLRRWLAGLPALEPGTSSGFCTGGLFPQDLVCDLRIDVPLVTAGNRSVPMACGPNVDQSRHARGGSSAPHRGAWLARRPPPAAPDKRARLASALLGGALAGSRPGTSPLCRRCPWSAKLYPSALLVQTVHTTMAVWRKEQRNQCKPRPADPLHAKPDRAGS
jgi:hypothetical protein